VNEVDTRISVRDKPAETGRSELAAPDLAVALAFGLALLIAKPVPLPRNALSPLVQINFTSLSLLAPPKTQVTGTLFCGGLRGGLFGSSWFCFRGQSRFGWYAWFCTGT